MSSDVVLTAALRNNLLSLQNTQSLIDKTQLRLATGLKINSALDGPANFFAAQALDNRASDLSRLLDGISQSIRTIEEADAGVTALTGLIEQSQSIVNSARDELAASEGVARVVGTLDLSSTADITTAFANVDAGDEIRIITTDDAGTQIAQNIAIAGGDTGASLAARITNTFADSENGEIFASISSDGNLQIESDGGRAFRITTVAGGTELVLAGFQELGIGDGFEVETRGGAALAATTVVAGNTAQSISLFEGAGDLVEAGDLLTGTYVDGAGNTVFSGFLAGDTITFNVDDGGAGATSGAFAIAAGSTFQDLVDNINQTAAVNELISASFDSSTGTLSISSLSDTVANVELTYTAAAATTFDIGLGDATGNLDPTGGAAGTYDTVFRFNSSTEQLDSLAVDYNLVREQIDDLVSDAQYRGINLLNGDDLTTFFNEDNTSTLTTNGVTFTANGLSITEATFRSSTDIELSATQTRTALETVRSFGSSLANNLAIIQTRQTFTQQTINTLLAGADDLTVADQNEEGANLLALQTRQTLGVTSLSLASQSQQAVLRLF